MSQSEPLNAKLIKTAATKRALTNQLWAKHASCGKCGKSAVTYVCT